jgi:hypothetical protein
MLLGFPLIAGGRDIAGKVINRIDYQPLAGVSVRIDGTVTGDDGRYLIPGMKGGNYVLEFSFVGMKTVRKEIRLTDKTRCTGNTGNDTKINVRGLEDNRVQIYMDGYALNTPDGSFNINDIPLQLIDRINSRCGGI